MTPTATPADSGSPTWTATANMAQARVGHTATLLADGRVLVAGGYDRDAALNAHGFPRPLASAELYDPSSGRWTSTGSMTTARQGHTATLLPDGKVLVVGGGGEEILEEGPAYSATAEVYDPSSGRWTDTSPLADARFGHTATMLPNGMVLVVGVSIGPSPVATAELYDPRTGRWTTTGSMTTGAVSHTATLLPDGRLLVVGGHGAGSEPEVFDSAELYDPGDRRWTATGSLPKGSFLHTATLLADGSVLVVVGYNDDGLATAELFDPANGRWTATGNLAQARLGLTATLLADGRVLVAGGSDSEAARIAGVEPRQLATAELYEPSSGRWSATASMVSARSGHTATLLADGSVLVAGGIGGIAPASSELYSPNR